jgi:membrane protein required for colicin V production
MNWLDLVILLVIAWFTIAGATAGLPRELVTLVAMLAGVVLAGAFYDNLAADILVMVKNDRTARVAAFIAIFLAVFGAGQIVAVLLRDVASALALGPLNHVGGLIIGLLKGVIIVETALILFARYQYPTVTGAMDGSLLTPFFLHGFPFLLNLLPADFRAAVEAFPEPLSEG